MFTGFQHRYLFYIREYPRNTYRTARESNLSYLFRELEQNACIQKLLEVNQIVVFQHKELWWRFFYVIDQIIDLTP